MLRRHQTQTIKSRLAQFRVVTVVGARQVGKTTVIREIVSQMQDARYLSLDSEAVRTAALNDPEGLTSGDRGTLAIDEVQRAPDLMLAIKTHADSNDQRGQFLISGSADLTKIKNIADTLPGRNAFVRLRGLSEAEIREVSPFINYGKTLIDELFEGRVPQITTDDLGLPQVSNAMTFGSFPEIRLQKPDSPAVFFDSYVDALLGHEVDEIARIDSKRGLRRVLGQVAARTSSLLSMSDIGQTAGISQHTVERYVSTLESLYLIERLPAWSRNIDQRQVKMAKAHLTDAGLTAHLLGIDPRTVDVITGGSRLGQVFETFVINEALKANDLSFEPAEAFHYRDRDRHEVDLIFERRNGDVIALEIKSSSKIERKDLRGINKLSERLGKQLKAGIIVYTGNQTVPFERNIAALPVSSFWNNVEY